MARSAEYNKVVNSVSATEFPLILVEIDHSGLTEPVRVVNDQQDITHNGDLFQAMNFSIKIPNQPETGRVGAKITIDNIGKELISWLEVSNGGSGSTAKLIQVLRSVPNVTEAEYNLYLTNISIDANVVSATLSYTDIYNQTCFPYVYNVHTAPGLF